MTRAVLVVDDAADARSSIALTLTGAGLACVEAATVADAINALAAGDFACVVLDLKLDADPETLHRALAERRVPVLLVSGVEAESLADVAQRHGWRYLAKPWEPPSLVMAVDRLLGGARASVTGSQSALTVQPDGGARVTKSTAQVVGDTLIRLVTAVAFGAELIHVRPASEWVNLACAVGLLLTAGVPIAELSALLGRGLLPGRPPTSTP